MYKLIPTLLFSFSLTFSSAQLSFYGGSIQVNNSGLLLFDARITATVVAYAKEGGTPPETIQIAWGDGTTDQIVLFQDVLIENGVQRIQYKGDHTYTFRATYTISTELCCISESIVNILEPTIQPLRLQTVYTFPNIQLMEPVSNTPIYVQPGFDLAQVDNDFEFNPNVYDPDNDSLTYELYPQILNDQGYQLPDELDNGGAASFTIDEQEGTLKWDQPSEPDREYLVPILIVSYRNGFPLDSTFYFMTIATEDITSSAIELGSSQSISISPNPGHRNFRLKGIQGNAMADLYNQQGQVVKSWKQLTDNERIVINQVKGLYYLSVRDRKSVQTLALVLK